MLIQKNLWQQHKKTCSTEHWRGDCKTLVQLPPSQDIASRHFRPAHCTVYTTVLYELLQQLDTRPRNKVKLKSWPLSRLRNADDSSFSSAISLLSAHARRWVMCQRKIWVVSVADFEVRAERWCAKEVEVAAGAVADEAAVEGVVARTTGSAGTIPKVMILVLSKVRSDRWMWHFLHLWFSLRIFYFWIFLRQRVLHYLRGLLYFHRGYCQGYISKQFHV